MTPALAKSIFALALVCWGILRYPYQHRASRTPVRKSARGPAETFLIASATVGLGLIPIIYIATGFPRFAEHGFLPGLAYAGALLFALALWLFHRAHHDLGRNFSVSLDVRENHTLVTSGIYAFVRHPMYLAFLLWALAQSALLSNWFAGFSGLLGFGVLYFGRIEQEEKLMLDAFGDEYITYKNGTARIVPGIY